MTTYCTEIQRALEEELSAHSEEGYRLFSSSLLPDVPRILGVRLPCLRKMAGRIVKREGWRQWLDEALKRSPDHESFEEIMVQGMVMGCAPFSGDKSSVWEQRAVLVRRFVPKINNWSVCDSFCAGLSALAEDKKALKSFLTPYVSSAREFDVRFAVVMMLDHFTAREDMPWLLVMLNRARHEGYYARMGTAWALSVCYVRFPEETWNYLDSDAPDTEILALTLRKILESRRVKGAEREAVQALRRRLKTQSTPPR